MIDYNDARDLVIRANSTIKDAGFAPNVIEKAQHNMCAINVYDKLLENRIIWIDGEVTAETASNVISSLLYLQTVEGHEDDDITMYINSPGGSCRSGLAIYDVMKMIAPDVVTINVGMAASMASILLAGGTKGKRKALKNSRVMIHQPFTMLCGAMSPEDAAIEAKELQVVRDQLFTILSDATGKSKEELVKDAQHDFFLSAEEALEYGLIDEIV